MVVLDDVLDIVVTLVVLVVVETLDGAIIINVPVMAVGWFSQ